MHVLPVGHRLQVIGVHAYRSATKMVNLQPIRDGIDEHLVRPPVGKHKTLSIPEPAAPPVRCSSPQPAVIRELDVTKEKISPVHHAAMPNRGDWVRPGHMSNRSGRATHGRCR